MARYGLSEAAIRKTFAGYYATFFEKNNDSQGASLSPEVGQTKPRN